MRMKSLLATTVMLLPVTRVALADSLQLTLNTSALVNISSPNDNHYGEYTNVPSEPFQMTLPEAWGLVSLPVPNLSLSVPTGSTITSALETFFVPSQEILGTGHITVPGETYPGRVPYLPSVAPTFSTTGTSEISVDGFSVSVAANVSGDQVSFTLQDLTVDYVGQIESALENPGSNWAGYLGGSGQVDIPYTVQLDVAYSPTPEPSSFVLLCTGALGIVGMVRRSFAR